MGIVEYLQYSLTDSRITILELFSMLVAFLSDGCNGVNRDIVFDLVDFDDTWDFGGV